MDYKELFEKYQKVLLENNSLKAENTKLKELLGIPEKHIDISNKIAKTPSLINQNSEAKEKIDLFRTLFKGRDDVYAKRYIQAD